MCVCIVKRDLPWVTTAQLAAAQKAAIEKSREFTANGKDVRHVRSVFIPDESKCMCLFETADSALVKGVNEAAQLPFTEIKEALNLTPGLTKILSNMQWCVCNRGHNCFR